MDFKSNYLKYKEKYITLKNNIISNGNSLEKYGGACETLVKQLNEHDYKLVEAAVEFCNIHCDKDEEALYPLVAAMIHRDGTIVYGLAAKGPLSNSVHGEHSVLTNARIKDHNRDNFMSLVCVSKNLKFKSPCGNCRELLKHHYPNLDIIVPDLKEPENTAKLVKIKSKYLLPYPYESGVTLKESKLDVLTDVTTSI